MLMHRRAVLAALVTVGLSVGLSTDTALAEGRENPETIRVALLPDENAATIIQNAAPLRDYLAERLGRDVDIVVTTDYSSMIEAMRFGRVEVGYFGPLSYVLAKSRAPEIEPFAIGVSGGSPTYRSILIATADGPVKSLADVSGKPFAFGDQASTSSHLAPRTVLAKTGLKANEDYRPVYLGKHDSVARAVAAGQVPAGGLSEEIYKVLVEDGRIDASKVRVLGYSDPLPNYPLTMQGYLAPELKDQIRDAFLGLDDAEILGLFRIDRLVPATDADYDVLRDMATILNLDLAKVN